MFTAWCHARRNVEPLGASPETVAALLAGQASVGVKPSTLTRRLAAIGYAHELAGLLSPTKHGAVRAVLRGIRREMGMAPAQKAPTTAERMTAMLGGIEDDTLAGKRDRAFNHTGGCQPLGQSARSRRDALDGVVMRRGVARN